MTIIWDGASGDRATTSSVNGITIDTTCAFSACGWMTGSSSARSPFGIGDTVNTLQFEVLRRAATNTLNCFGYGSSPKFNNLDLPASTTEWWFWAFSISGTAIGNANLYVWTEGGGWTTSANIEALQTMTTPNLVAIGNGPIITTTEGWIGDSLGYRVWNATLTAEEIYREKQSITPRRIAGLTHALPMLGVDAASTFRDLCGNAWSLSGTVAYKDSVPANVGYGAKIILPQAAVAAGNIPVLSLPGVQNIASTTARPKVTLTYA